jgi:hypothetical protein
MVIDKKGTLRCEEVHLVQIRHEYTSHHSRHNIISPSKYLITFLISLDTTGAIFDKSRLMKAE